MKIICGNSNPELSKDIIRYLNTFIDSKEVNSVIEHFADGECRVEINDNLRGQDVFVIQSTSTPVNDNLMEMLVIIDAVKRSSAKRITAVMPYFGYARQDRQVGSRVPITAKLVANLITEAGADRLFTIDLHAGQIQGFFDIPVDLLSARPLLIYDMQQKFAKQIKDNKLIFVSPDTGGAERTRSFAKIFDADIAIIDKRRPEPGQSQVMNVVGDVKGKWCILIDDLCDSAGTLKHGAQALMDKDAMGVTAYTTHGVLTGKAGDNIDTSVMDEIVFTNTIRSKNNEIKKVRYTNIAPLIGQAILRIHDERSVSELLSVSSWDRIALSHRDWSETS